MKQVTVNGLKSKGGDIIEVGKYVLEDTAKEVKLVILDKDFTGVLTSPIEDGVRDYKAFFDDKKFVAKFYPKDGIKFLKQLKYLFRSGYLSAGDVEAV